MKGRVKYHRRVLCLTVLGAALVALYVSIMFSLLTDGGHSSPPLQLSAVGSVSPFPSRYPRRQPLPVDVVFTYVNGSVDGFAEELLQFADLSQVPFGLLRDKQPPAGIEEGGGVSDASTTTTPPFSRRHTHNNRALHAISSNNPRFRNLGELYYSLRSISLRYPTCAEVSFSDEGTSTTTTCRGRTFLVVASPAQVPSFCVVAPASTRREHSFPLITETDAPTCSVCFHHAPRQTCMTLWLVFHTAALPAGSPPMATPTFNSNAIEASLLPLLLATTSSHPPTTPLGAAGGASVPTLLLLMNDDMLLGRGGSGGVAECLLAPSPAQHGGAPPLHAVWFVERTHQVWLSCLFEAVMGNETSSSLPPPPLHEIIDVCGVTRIGAGISCNETATKGRQLAAEYASRQQPVEATVHYMGAYALRHILRLKLELLGNAEQRDRSLFPVYGFAHTPKLVDKRILSYFLLKHRGSWGGLQDDRFPVLLPVLPPWWWDVVAATRSHRFRSATDLWLPFAYPYMYELYANLASGAPMGQLSVHNLYDEDANHAAVVESAYATATRIPDSCSESPLYYYASLSSPIASVPKIQRELHLTGNTSLSGGLPLFVCLNDDYPFLSEEDGALEMVQMDVQRLLDQLTV